jgi:hypothetical protein
MIPTYHNEGRYHLSLADEVVVCEHWKGIIFLDIGYIPKTTDASSCPKKHVRRAYCNFVSKYSGSSLAVMISLVSPANY